MMLGEIEYEDLYYPQKQMLKNMTEIVSESEHQTFPGTAHFVVLLFIFLASIILMNLLIGLAVSDIQSLSKSAKLNQLVQQVELINYMEGWLVSPLFQWAPPFMQRYLKAKLNGLQGQNYNLVYSVNPLDVNDRLFPEALKKSLHENCLRFGVEYIFRKTPLMWHFFRRQTKLKDLMQQEALDEMQMNIQQIASMLSKSYNSSSLLSKNLQKRTK